MNRAASSAPTTFGRELTLRMSRTTAAILEQHMRQDPRNEQMAFGLGRMARTADGTIFLVRDLLLPDADDLSEQTAVSVCPTPGFLSMVYYQAHQTQSSVVEFHSHPGGHTPVFSGVDERHSRENAVYLTDKLDPPTTLVMVVGNNRFDAFDGVAFDRHTGQFHPLHRFELLGRPSEIRFMGEEPRKNRAHEAGDERFDRQQRIPGWNQLGLERQRIGIIGAGGNGAPLLQMLVSIGAGRHGFIALCDDDLVEESNLPRIPYAFAEQAGTPKANAAVHYAARKSPGTPVYAYPCRFEAPEVQARMKAATVLFYCGDNDGGRKEANAFAMRYGIPLIEMGCDIQVEQESVTAGGQVRLVLPGENACLVCCRGFDPALAALEQMDAVSRIHHARQGYVIGADAEATASVANLNVLTVQFAVAQFLALVNGPTFARWDYLHVNQFTGQTMPARSKRRADCPLCGREGVVLAGDPVETARTDAATLVPFDQMA